MKVCMITGSFPSIVCGVGDYTENLCRALTESGMKIAVLTTDDPSINKSCRSKQSEMEILPCITSWNWRAFFHIFMLLKKNNPDIVHIQYQTSIYDKRAMITFLPLLLKMLMSGIKVFVTLHDLEGPYLFPGARRLSISRFFLVLFLFSNGVTVSGERNKYNLSNLFCFTRRLKNKIKIVPIGSNLPCRPSPDFDPLKVREKWGLSSEEFLLTTFGFVESSQDFRTIFYAMAKLLREGIKVKLLVVGGKGKTVYGFTNYYEEIRSFADRLGILERVIFTGYCSNKEASDLALSSHVGIMLFSDPGYLPASCAFPFLLSHSLPVIIAKGENLPEWLIDGHNVSMAPPRDLVALAQSIRKLLFSKSLKEKLGTNARLLFEKKYSFECIAHEIKDLYRFV